MAADRQQVSYGHAHSGIGVNGLGPPKEVYEPSKHTDKVPLRAGSMDAYKQPSLDYTGERKPYWGNLE